MNYPLIELVERARAYRLDIESHILERGRDYWQRGLVHSIERRSDGGLSAIVEGSDDYEVNLEVSLGTKGLLLHGDCDCPYWHTCKHVGALFLEFLYREGDGSSDGAVDLCLESIAALVLPAVEQQEQEQARLQLLMHRRVDRAAGGEHFFSVQLMPQVMQRGKKGNWLKPKAAIDFYGNIKAEGLNPDHRHLLRWLLSMDERYSVTLPVDLPPVVLADYLAIAMDEAILIDAEDETLMARGEARVLNIRWLQDGDNHQLVWELEGELLCERLQLIPAGKGFWFCDLDQGLMGEVQSVFSAKRVAVAGRLPVLTVEQRDQVEEGIVQHFSAPEVLSLSAAAAAPERQAALQGKLLRVNEQSEGLQPCWLYEGDLQLRANPDCERSYLAAERCWLLRDVAGEAAALDELAAVTQLDSGRRDSRGDLTLFPESDFNWPFFSIEIAPVLESLGWQIELPDRLQFVARDVHELSVDMDEGSSGGWWFEVGFSVECEGRKLPLVPILGEWIGRHGLGEGPLEGLADDELFPLNTDSEGNVWRVPAGLLRTLVRQFADLIDAADGDHLKMPAPALGHLDAVLEDLPTTAWQPPARFAALVDKLGRAGEPQLMPAPEGFNAELRPYQQGGLGWLGFLADTGMHGILADDMGLGKTVQTLAHMVYQRRANPDAPPVLVVAPTSVVGNWRRETEKFAPELKQLTLYGPKRQAWFDRLGEFDLVLTSYALLQRDREVLQAQPFSLVVLDEAQWIKNPRAKTAMAAKVLQAERRLCLSGTPMENHTGELWSLFDFLMPGFLGSEKRFRACFRNPIEKDADPHALARLRARTAPFILRRSKQLVASDLPARNEMVQSVEMGSGQKAVYEAVRAQMQKKVRDALAARGLGQSHIIVLEALLKLRQTCCDPRLLPNRTKGRDKAKSAKLELLMELLPTLVEEGRRVLLFSQFTSMLDLIEAELKDASIDYLKLTGRSRNRDKLVEDFQAGAVPVFLISLKAGGVGLNLTAADTVIIYDPWWNPAVEQQAIDRAHRIGQDKPVFVYRLVTEGSIEEKILQLQEQKRLLTSGVMEDSDVVPTGLSESQILDLLQPV